MGQEPAFDTPEFRALKSALEQEWPHRQAALLASGVPLNDESDPDLDPDPPEPDLEHDAKPPWGDDFDPERAWKLVSGLKKDVARAKHQATEAIARAKKYEDENKSEAQKLQERAETAEQKLATAERNSMVASVALAKGLTEAQTKRLIGTTKEELEADADELLSTFAPSTNGGQDPSRSTRERLRPGAVPSAEEEEHDPAKLAAQVPRRGF